MFALLISYVETFEERRYANPAKSDERRRCAIVRTIEKKNARELLKESY